MATFVTFKTSKPLPKIGQAGAQLGPLICQVCVLWWCSGPPSCCWSGWPAGHHGLHQLLHLEDVHPGAPQVLSGSCCGELELLEGSIQL